MIKLHLYTSSVHYFDLVNVSFLGQYSTSIGRYDKNQIDQNHHCVSKVMGKRIDHWLLFSLFDNKDYFV